MSKIKKTLSLILASLLIAGAVTGCGSNAPKTDTGSSTVSKVEEKKEMVTVRVWGGVPEEAGPQKSIDEFNTLFKDKGVQAEYVRFVNDDTGNLKLETTLLAGEGVDVYITYGLTPLQKRVAGNMALDLTEYCKKDSFDIAENFSDLAKNFMIDGKYYCIPTKVDLYGMVINEDMFKAAGIPIPTKWNYSEFREVAKKLTKGEGDNKVYGAFLNTQQDLVGTVGYMGVQALSGDWMYKAGGKETNFDNPILKSNLQLTYDMMNVDKSIPSHTDSVTQKLTQEGMFLSGKSAMTIGPWIVRSIKDTKNYPHDFKTAFAPYPVPDNGEIKYSQGQAGDLISINSKSKNTDAAWEYVKWYTTQGMLPMAQGGRVPLYKGYDSAKITEAFLTGAEKLLDAKTVADVLIKPRENYAVQTLANKAPELTQIFKEEFESILNGKASVEQGTKKMKTRGDKILGK